MATKFVAYYRVSTDRQGKSGLGLEAQREAVRSFLANGGWPPAAEFTEVESGRMDARPQLAAALSMCKLTGATLVVAKLDRLARNVRFLLNVIEGTGHGGVVFCDLPHIPAGPVGTFMLQQMAAVAQLEAGLISQRTKAALGAAKARGVALGGYRGGPVPDAAKGGEARKAGADAYAADVAPIARQLQTDGMGLRGIAAELASRGIRTPQGGAWTGQAVKNLLAR